MFVFLRCFMVVFIVGKVHCVGTITNPQPVYVNLGEEAVLQCNTAASKMKWVKTDVTGAIASESDTINDSKYYTSKTYEGLYYRLHIRNVVTADLTKYYCVVSGSVDYYYLQIYLKVSPTSLSLYDVTDNKIRGTEGQRLTITCTATGGQPPPEITLTVGGNIRLGVQSVSYIIPVLQRSHDKQPVRCQANNTALDTPMIREAVLYLFLKPSTPILSEKNPRANETQLLTISCTSVGSRPAAIFYWILNQAFVPTGFTQQNISDPTTETYNVTSTLTYKVDRSYNGKTITCGVNHSTLTNPLESTEQLTVYYAPVVTVADRTYTQHDDIRTVTCIPVGNPPLYTYYKWQHKSKYGELIRYLDGGDNGVLILPNLSDLQRYQDSGEYKCTVSNGIGNENGDTQQSASGIVKVQAQPVFANEWTKQIEYGEIEKDFIKHYHVYSVPKYFSTSLYKNDGATNLMDRSKYQITDLPDTVNIPFHGVVVQQDGYKMILTIKALKESDFNTNYIFECLNQFGKSGSYFTLKSASAPQTPLNFSVISTTHSSLIVQWIPGYSGGADQTFHVQYREVNSTEDWYTVDVPLSNEKSDILMYTVPRLKANTMYQLKMYSDNVYNRSKYTDIENAYTVAIGKASSQSISTDLIGGIIGSLVSIIIILLVIISLKYQVFQRLSSSKGYTGRQQQNKEVFYENMTGATYEEINGQQTDKTKCKGSKPTVPSSESPAAMYEMLGGETNKAIYDDLTRQEGRKPTVPSSESPVAMYEMFGGVTNKAIYDDLTRQEDSPEKEYINLKF